MSDQPPQQPLRPTTAEIVQAVDEAAALTHKHRAMRVTLECAHMRLMPWINCVMGIGAQTACAICPKDDDGRTVARMVVNVEETGRLDDSWPLWFKNSLRYQASESGASGAAAEEGS